MLLNESVSNFPAPSVAWSDIARVCRRVCVLRERGRAEEAERLRANELMPMVLAVRMPTDTDASVTERLNSIFAIEAERVANASVLAELLVPILAEKLQPSATSSAPNVSAAAPLVTPASNAAKPPAPRPASIADFIDEMIAQEKPPVHSGSAGQRRAS